MTGSDEPPELPDPPPEALPDEDPEEPPWDDELPPEEEPPPPELGRLVVVVSPAATEPVPVVTLSELLFSTVVPEVVTDVMAGLNREGKSGHWGISESNEDYLRRVHAVCPVTAVENRYFMMACALGHPTVTGRTISICCVAG